MFVWNLLDERFMFLFCGKVKWEEMFDSDPMNDELILCQ